MRLTIRKTNTCMAHVLGSSENLETEAWNGNEKWKPDSKTLRMYSLLASSFII